MDGEKLVIIAMPVVCLLMPLLVGYGLVKTHRMAMFLILLAALVAATIWFYWKAETAAGWNAIGYGAGMVLITGPALIGALIGWLIASLRNAKLRRSASHPTDPE